MRSIEIPYTPPYDWELVVEYYRKHQLPFIESVSGEGYERVVQGEHGPGWFRINNLSHKNAIRLTTNGLSSVETKTLARHVRWMLDLEAPLDSLTPVMRRDRVLATIWDEHEGLRVARAFSPFESVFTTVLGQLVSVSYARKLVEQLMTCSGTAILHPKTLETIVLFPSAVQILQADLSVLRTSEIRRQTVRNLARAFASSNNRLEKQSGNELRKVLQSIPGVGPWTVEYALLRGFGDNDAFPATDYVLKRALRRNPRLEPEAFRPWRSYMAVALWTESAKHTGKTLRRNFTAKEEGPA